MSAEAREGCRGHGAQDKASTGVESLQCQAVAVMALGQEAIKEIMAPTLISAVQQTLTERQALGSLHSSLRLFIQHLLSAWHII